jgi:uncharacterized protein (DUF2164 family)
MAVKLDAEVKKRAAQALRGYCERELEQSIGNLDAEFLLDFVVAQVGPVIYNRAIADVQVYFRDRLAELDGDLFEPEGSP